MLDQVGLHRKALRGVRTAGGLLAGSAEWHAGTVVVMDVDAMTSINRTFGTRVGDDLLARIETALGAAVAGRGHVTSYGGDQFLVLVLGDHPHDHLVRELSGVVRRVRAGRAHATASAGISSWSGERPASVALLAAAAASLATAKGARGRGRTRRQRG